MCFFSALRLFASCLAFNLELFSIIVLVDSDAHTEKATDEKNTSEKWDIIMEICDKARLGSKHAKDCLRAIVPRLGHTDPHVAVQAITVRIIGCDVNTAV